MLCSLDEGFNYISVQYYIKMWYSNSNGWPSESSPKKKLEVILNVVIL